MRHGVIAGRRSGLRTRANLRPVRQDTCDHPRRHPRPHRRRGPLGVQPGRRGPRARGRRQPARRGRPAARAAARWRPTSASARAVTEQAYEPAGRGGLAGGAARRAARSSRRAAPLGRPRPARRTPSPADAGLVRLDAGTPWIDPRYAASWRRAWREVAAARPPRGYDDPRGLPELRAELAARLGRTRGLDCDPDEVVVTAGTTDGLRHLLGELPPGAGGDRGPGLPLGRRHRAARRPRRPRPPRARAGDRPERLRGGVRDARPPAPARPDHARQRPARPPRRGPGGGGGRRRGRLRLRVPVRRRARARAGQPRPRPRRLPRHRQPSRSRRACGWAGWSRRRTSSTPSTGPAGITHDTASWPVQRAFLSLLRDGYVDKVVRSARRVYADRAARVAGRAGAVRPAARAGRGDVRDRRAAARGATRRAVAAARDGRASRCRCSRTTAAARSTRAGGRLRRLHRRRARPRARRAWCAGSEG